MQMQTVLTVSHPAIVSLHINPLPLLELAQPALGELDRRPEYRCEGWLVMQTLPGCGTEHLDPSQCSSISHGRGHLGPEFSTRCRGQVRGTTYCWRQLSYAIKTQLKTHKVFMASGRLSAYNRSFLCMEANFIGFGCLSHVILIEWLTI